MHAFAKDIHLGLIIIILADIAEDMIDVVRWDIGLSDNGLGVVWFCLLVHGYSLINYTFRKCRE